MMSVDIWLVAIEKERSLPMESFWLGGNGVRRKMLRGDESPLYGREPLVTNGKANYYPVTVLQAEKLLWFLGDDLYDGHEAVEAVKFVIWMTTLAGREKHVLYVEEA